MRPRVFMDFESDGQPLGRVLYELYDDTAPRTVENFRALCTGEKGSTEAGIPLYYKTSPMHRCIKNFMVQGGDFAKRNGTGGVSIYGGYFPDEDLSRPLDSEGLLCMANRGPDTNGSQFFVTLNQCPHLNGKHVVFGRVIRGYEQVIERIANVETDEKDRPRVPVTISGCGELELQRKPVPAKRGRSESIDKRRSDSPSRSRSRSRSRSADSERILKKTKKKKHGKSKSKKLADDVPRMPTGETEEEYDLRLEREENERIEAAREAVRRREEERTKRRHQDAQSGDGTVRLKGRGRMMYRDPDLERGR
ncbi:hypothetical protein CYLTODRAFT_249295 [Cylindrobasidium torrendii FP15055 ss-10]|uniref:peptidylprolyl isomerase n=1 Tax=Cylindrobasidium torrendii FP15055 ss-10 TaxID=1314674 RepID=A0A0D7BFD7_9AGAR|nr:hypothetical protein CYLTODRAFT_249295 [Cylindrobasidium torrendii FP15055 ss-10]